MFKETAAYADLFTMMRLGLALLLLALGSACGTSGHAPEPGSDSLSKTQVRTLIRGVFEIVIPKGDDSFVIYERPLPYDQLPFKERNDKFVGIGTAFSLEQGRYITAAHVLGLELASLRHQYYLRDSQGKVFPIRNIYRYSQYRDLAEFSVEGAPQAHVTLRHSASSEAGDTVYTVGNAYGSGISIRGGQIASYTPEEDNGRWEYIRYSAPASPGNSGGPLLNERGEVVGIVVKKNHAENLNFAVPIRELLNLSRSRSEFFLKNVPYKEQSREVHADWSFATPLPATVSQLSLAAQRSRYQFHVGLMKQFDQKHAAEIFPNDPKLDTYLRAQSFKSGFLMLGREANGNWGAEGPREEKITVAEDQDLLYQKLGDGEAVLLLEKPQGMRLRDFIADPKLIFDTILKVTAWSRQFAGAQIKILSYGKPHQSKWVQDRLGRAWMISLWRTSFDDSFHQLSCLPMPNAVACHWLYSPIRYETVAIRDFALRIFNRLMLSYGEKLKNWPEYLALPKAVLPRVIQTATFAFNQKTGLQARFGGYEIRLKDPKLDANSNLSVFSGFGLTKPTEQRVLGLGLVYREDKNGALIAFTVPEPTKLNPEAARKKWEDMLSRRAPYHGKAFTSNNAHMIQYAMDPRNRSIASIKKGQPIRLMQLISCMAPTEENPKALESACRGFVGGLRLE